MQTLVNSPERARALTLLLGVALGLAADRLFWNGLAPGLGFALWIGLLGAASTFLAWRATPELLGAAAGWSAMALAAAALMATRQDPFLQFVLWLALLFAASMVVLRALGTGGWETRLRDHVFALAMVPARALAGAVPLLASARLPGGDARRRLGAVLRGLLLAAPLLLVFAALFASADAAFDRYVLGFLSPDLVQHLALTLLFGWLAAGLLSTLSVPGPRNPLDGIPLPRIGREETAVVMGLLAALFLIFVVLQLGYLFGGRETIESVSGLTLADYARRGFFELLAAAALTLAVLLAGEGMTAARALFRPLAGVLIACVLLMLVSALQRLALYIGEFGLTLDRLDALAVMAWLAIMLLLFAFTVLRGLPLRFAPGAALSGVAIVFLLALLNPAAIVARVNMARGLEGEQVDVQYLLSLGPDAVPVLVERLDQLASPARCELAEAVLLRWGPGEPAEADWRRWHAALAAAAAAVEERLAELGERARPSC